MVAGIKPLPTDEAMVLPCSPCFLCFLRRDRPTRRWPGAFPAGWRAVVTAGCVGLVWAGSWVGDSVVLGQPAATPEATSRWEPEIEAFEAADREAPPRPGGVVFVGSSSIRLWDLEAGFPGLGAVNRGFGGSHVVHSADYAGRIVIPHAPRVIVFYAGDNDVAAGTTPERVAADFGRFVSEVRSALPEVEIIFIAIKPSPARWKWFAAQQETNRLIRRVCEAMPGLAYVDVVSPMLGPDGAPRVELFRSDGLHLSDEGYRLWNELVGPVLDAAVATPSGTTP